MSTTTATETADVRKHCMQTVAASITSRYPSRVRPLATPPVGSNLKPVMGDHGPPFIGHIMSTLADPLDFARQRYERFGVSWAGGVGFRIVALMGPEALAGHLRGIRRRPAAHAYPRRNGRGPREGTTQGPGTEVVAQSLDRRMHGTGEYTITDLAGLFNISRPTVYRTLASTETVAVQRNRQ